MFFAFFILLMLNGAVLVLLWLGWQRVTNHLKNHAEATRLLLEHIITPLLIGEKKPKGDEKPEPKRIKGTLV